jgi:poly(3-hydroxybutyrate) depolymerase
MPLPTAARLSRRTHLHGARLIVFASREFSAASRDVWQHDLAMRTVTAAVSLAMLAGCGGSSTGGTDGGSADAAFVLPFVLPDAGHHASSAGSASGTTHGADAGGRSSGASTGETHGASSAPPTTLMRGTTTLSLSVGGMARTAILHVPASATSDAPLVIALHGDGDTDTNFVATSGLGSLSDADGFVLVAPQGIPRNVSVDGQTVPDVDWDAYTPAGMGNIDLELLEQLRTQLAATHEVDADRTFVFGYSQGGYMSFLYGMSYASVLSCAAVLAASSPYGGGTTDPLITGAARKIPVALQIGTEDEAFAAAETTEMTLMAGGFPVQWTPVSGAGHVPIPGSVSVPLAYCLGQSL